MKSVLITGGNRGLGAALVAAFADAGWHVATTARHVDPANSDGVYQLDLSQPESVAACAEAMIAEGWKYDLVIHNAGFNPKDRKVPEGYFQSTFSIAQFSAANVAETLWVNALMPMEFTSRLMPALATDAIVLGISSWLGSIGGKTAGGHYGYAGSKALLNMFLRGLALEFGEGGRSAVALNPGWMQTDMGGSKADVSPRTVADQIVGMAGSGTLREANGRFINADGSPHQW